MERNWIQHQGDDSLGSQRYQVKNQSRYVNIQIMPWIGISARYEIQHFLARGTLKTVKHDNKSHMITNPIQNLRRKGYTGECKSDFLPTLWTDTIYCPQN